MNMPVQAYLFPSRDNKGKRTKVLLLGSRRAVYSLANAKNLYRKRFRIENTYRHARLFKIRTSTRKIQLRWIMWALAHFLELIWQLIRYVYQVQGVDSYRCRQKQFIRILQDVMGRLSSSQIQ